MILGICCVLAIVVGGWLFFLDSNEVQAPTTSGMQVFVEGQNAYIQERKNYRIRSIDELQELWTMTYGPGAPLIPQVDFATREVLAVFDGSHSSGGYRITVESVEDTPLARVVSIVRVSPGATCITTSALTSPFQMVVVERTDLPIQRKERSVIEECE